MADVVRPGAGAAGLRNKDSFPMLYIMLYTRLEYYEDTRLSDRARQWRREARGRGFGGGAVRCLACVPF